MKFIFLFAFSILGTAVFGQLKEATQNAVPTDLKSKEKKEVFNSPAALAKSKAKKMKTSLNLTDKQEASIYNVFFKYETDTEKVQKSKLSKKEKFTKLNALSRDRQKQMQQILTKEQYHDYIMSFP